MSGPSYLFDQVSDFARQRAGRIALITGKRRIKSGGCLGGRIENGRIVQRQYDVARCTTRVQNYLVPGFQKVLGETLREKDSEKQKMILYSSMFSRTLWSMTYSNVSQGQCAECMRVCPVGLAHRTRHVVIMPHGACLR